MSSIIRREPFGSLFDQLFSDYFNRSGWPLTSRSEDAPAATLARMDVVDKGDKYAVTVDLPGVKKEDIRVTVEGSRVAISAESKSESETKEGDKVLYTERRAASYARAFELPVEVTEENADASYENGVLRLTLPKRAHVAGRRLTVR
ncbi:MAG TPA: Hsp20/alpha crystallin family protein [Burkholderiaceae bacterium]|nr:Hsp20/alpha crystallin family protein [Burkholderiaceae bacterium]